MSVTNVKILSYTYLQWFIIHWHYTKSY